MFCNKCGKELPDNAQFCSGCGNQVGTAPAAPAAQAAPAQTPLIFKRLIGQIVNFFTKKDPVGVVANSAKDNTFSGLLLAVFGAIVMALGAMVNVNQGMLAYAKNIYKEYGMKWTSEMSKTTAEKFPSGASFGMFLLLAVVVYAVMSVMVYVAVAKVAKKPISVSGACNIVAYASIPVIAVSLLNMLFGLIWFVLPVIFMLLGLCVTLCIIGSSVEKVTEAIKPLTVKALVFAVTAFIAIIFLWIALKTVNDAKDEAGAIIAAISNWFI